MNLQNLFILIILIFIFNKLFFSSSLLNNESFQNFYGVHCNTCNSKNFAQCLNCAECGFCIKGSSGECVKGDQHGPYDGRLCDMWYHSDPFSRDLWQRKKYSFKPITN
jgi:hypothetical protein